MPDACTVLVSFTIHPLHGSEAGVGWAFLEALLARDRREVVHLLFDARDHAAVRSAVDARPDRARVVLHPVPVPAPVLRHYGDRRTRQSYLAWLPGARHRLAALSVELSPRVVHQVTFASAVLPPVLGPGRGGRVVWGPLSVPSSAEGGAGRIRPLGEAAVRVALTVAARNVGAADLLVANNDHSVAFIEDHGGTATLEPNIVVERRAVRSGAVDEGRLVLAGHLIARKRPWLAIQALGDRRLTELRLDVVGDGPLRASLERLADESGVGARVRFLGAVPRAGALDLMSTSRLLVHPSSREGSPWVVGEAAACGLAAVVMPGSGSEATVRLSANGGVVAPAEPDQVTALAEGVLAALSRRQPEPSDRWSAARLPGLLDTWYR